MSSATVQQHLLAAARARQTESEQLALQLIELQAPAEKRELLQAIVVNGEETLQQISTFADPYLLARTQLQIAGAQIDLAGLTAVNPTGLTPTEQAAQQAEYLHKAAERCEIGIALAANSEFTIVALAIIPWALLLLTRALNLAEGVQRQALEARLSTASREFNQVLAQQAAERDDGRQQLLAAQFLAEATTELTDLAERDTVLSRAYKQIEAARKTLMAAGDWTAVRTADNQLTKIQQKLASKESPAAPEQPIATVVGEFTWQLIVIRGQSSGQTYPLEDVTRIGREASCEIWLSDPKISRRHALLERQGMLFKLTDLSSSNGTFVNGQRLEKPVYVQPGDTIRLGDTELTLQASG